MPRRYRRPRNRAARRRDARQQRKLVLTRRVRPVNWTSRVAAAIFVLLVAAAVLIARLHLVHPPRH